jgi:co-chaperonin GroES (HSP10)
VRLDIHDGRTKGGIFVPSTAQHSMTGVVEAVGKGVKDKALVPGVKVHFTRFAGATGDEIADGVICVGEAQLAGYFAPQAKRRKR